MWNPRKLVLLLATLSALTGQCFAQTVSGIITGSIFDPGGLPVAGVAVSLTNAETGDRRETKTETSGEFLFSSVLPGRYTLAIQLQGFKRLEKTDLNITQSERLSAGNLKLEVGGVSESITVSASGTAVDVESNDRSQVLTSDQLEKLQDRGRNYLELTNTLPGAAGDERFFGTDAMQSTLTPNFSGLSSSYNSVFVDGQISSSPQNPNYSLTNIAMDSVAQVVVSQSNYRAEDGRNGGAIIKTYTKSGTKDFHGSAYTFQRNEALNANFFFNNLTGTPRPRYRYHTYGGSIGGPIHFKNFNRDRDKLFFFYSGDYAPTLSPAQQALTEVTVPTALERAGNFSQTLTVQGLVVPITDPQNKNTPFPGNIVPQSRIDPAGQALLNLFPLPNFTNRAITGGNYNYVFLEAAYHLTVANTIRVDYNVNSRFRMYARLGLWRQDDESYRNSGQSWPMVKSHYHERFTNAALSGSYTISPTMVNELTIGGRGTPNWSSAMGSLSAVQRSALGVALPQSFPANNANDLLPSMSFGGVTGAASFGGTNLLNLGWKSSEPCYNITDNLTKVAGPHTFKGGIYFEHLRSIAPSSGNYAGSISFSHDTSNPLDTNYAYSNALMGVYDSYSETDSRPLYDMRAHSVEWYVQDTWKVTRRLTLDYGVRFTHFTPYEQANGKALNFEPGLYNPSQAVVLYRPVMSGGVRSAQNPLNGAIYPAVYIGAIVPGTGNPLNGTISQTAPGVPAGFVYTPAVLYGPRFGFAYDLTGDGKTAIRGGGGVSYNVRTNLGYPDNTVQNTQQSFTNYYGTIESIGSVSGTLFPRAIYGVNPNAKVPTIYSYSIGIQRDLGHGVLLDVAYVGNQTRQIQVTNGSADTVPFGAEFLPSSHDSTNNGTLSDNFFRPYMGYSSVALPGQTTSNYNSLQNSVLRRFTKGLQFGGSWTWSKDMGFYSPYAQYYSNQLNYGKLSIDHTHLVSLNYLWDIPKASHLVNVLPVRWIFDGWQTSGVVTFSSGRPWTVSYSMTSGPNITGGGDYNRVMVVGDPRLSYSDRTFNEFFNTAAFAAPPQVVGSIAPGNAPLDVAHGPGRKNFDSTFSRNFHIIEKANLQFRCEVYNIFNHPSFYQMNTSAQFNPTTGQQVNKLFGQLSNSLTPRVIQLALRLTF